VLAVLILILRGINPEITETLSPSSGNDKGSSFMPPQPFLFSQRNGRLFYCETNKMLYIQ
jgi:hypothetical protein